MGMFDWVDYECICPVCHKKVAGFQSKDGECYMNKVSPTSVDNFYSTCAQCGCWIEFTRKPANEYVRTVSGKGEKKMRKLPFGEIIKKHTKTIKL